MADAAIQYQRIPGYVRFDGGAIGSAVPGVGPILEVDVSEGVVYAVRSDGVLPVKWAATVAGWSRIV